MVPQFSVFHYSIEISPGTVLTIHSVEFSRNRLFYFSIMTEANEYIMLEDENGALTQLDGLLGTLGSGSPISDPDMPESSPVPECTPADRVEESNVKCQGTGSNLHLSGSNPDLGKNMGAARSGFDFIAALC